MSSSAGFRGGKLARFHSGGSFKCSTLHPMPCLCFCRCKHTNQCIVLNSVTKGTLMLILTAVSTSEICFLGKLDAFSICCGGEHPYSVRDLGNVALLSFACPAGWIDRTGWALSLGRTRILCACFRVVFISKKI